MPLSKVTLESIRRCHDLASERILVNTKAWPDTWRGSEICFVECAWRDVDELLREVERLQREVSS